MISKELEQHHRDQTKLLRSIDRSLKAKAKADAKTERVEAERFKRIEASQQRIEAQNAEILAKLSKTPTEDRSIIIMSLTLDATAKVILAASVQGLDSEEEPVGAHVPVADAVFSISNAVPDDASFGVISVLPDGRSEFNPGKADATGTITVNGTDPNLNTPIKPTAIDIALKVGAPTHSVITIDASPEDQPAVG